MKPKTFILRDSQVLSRTIEFLKSLKQEPLIEVVVREYQEDRSALQNSLYWYWVGIIAKHRGWTKEDVHFDLRKRLLVPIFEADEPGYARMINAIRRLFTKGFKQDALSMHEQIVKMTSTTSATVKQFTEFLNEIERDSLNDGIVLPRKEDQHWDDILGDRNGKM